MHFSLRVALRLTSHRTFRKWHMEQCDCSCASNSIWKKNDNQILKALHKIGCGETTLKGRRQAWRKTCSYYTVKHPWREWSLLHWEIGLPLWWPMHWWAWGRSSQKPALPSPMAGATGVQAIAIPPHFFLWKQQLSPNFLPSCLQPS